MTSVSYSYKYQYKQRDSEVNQYLNIILPQLVYRRQVIYLQRLVLLLNLNRVTYIILTNIILVSYSLGISKLISQYKSLLVARKASQTKTQLYRRRVQTNRHGRQVSILQSTYPPQLSPLDIYNPAPIIITSSRRLYMRLVL